MYIGGQTGRFGSPTHAGILPRQCATTYKRQPHYRDRVGVYLVFCKLASCMWYMLVLYASVCSVDHVSVGVYLVWLLVCVVCWLYMLSGMFAAQS